VDSLSSKFPVLAFVGSLEYEKRVDFAIEAAILLSAKNSNLILLIYGSGKLEYFVRQRYRDYPWIKFMGKADSEDYAEISKRALLLLNPGRVGLIAVDSMAIGVPIVTTDFGLHAPEIEYLELGHSYFMSQDSLSAYVELLQELIESPSKIVSARKLLIQRSNDFGTDKMAFRFHVGVKQCLGLKENHV
jgi:glycosyltransferase involved in cell wall biosynthesis